MSDLRKAVQDFLTHWDSPQWVATAKTVAAIGVMRKALEEPIQAEPVGRVAWSMLDGCWYWWPHKHGIENTRPVYLHPPKQATSSLHNEKYERRHAYRSGLVDRLIKKIDEFPPDMYCGLANLLDEAADTIANMENEIAMLKSKLDGNSGK